MSSAGIRHSSTEVQIELDAFRAEFMDKKWGGIPQVG